MAKKEPSYTLNSAHTFLVLLKVANSKNKTWDNLFTQTKNMLVERSKAASNGRYMGVDYASVDFNKEVPKGRKAAGTISWEDKLATHFRNLPNSAKLVTEYGEDAKKAAVKACKTIDIPNASTASAATSVTQEDKDEAAKLLAAFLK